MRYLLTLLVTASLSAAPTYVLDSEGRALLTLDTEKGTVIARTALPHFPTEILQSPDGTKLVVLADSKSTSSAVIVDAKTLAVGPRVELGAGLGEAAFTSDGKAVVVLVPKSGSLVKIDLAEGKEVKRVVLGKSAETFGVARDGVTGVVYTKKPVQVTFVSLDTLEAPVTVALPGKSGAPVSIPGSDSLYFLDAAKRDANLLHVVSIPERKLVASLPLGGYALMGGMHPESGRLFVLSDGQKKGTLHVVKGAAMAAAIDVPDDPAIFRMTADARRGYVTARSAVSVVDLVDEKALGEVAQYSGFGSGMFLPFEFLATPDGKRGFHYFRTGDQCCTLNVVDLENRKTLEDFQTGSKGERIAAALGAVAMSIESYQSGKAAAKANGKSTFWYTLYKPAGSGAPRGSFALRPDGAMLYALDTGTDDVTAVDVQTGARVANIDAASGVKELIMLGPLLMVAADEGLAFIDTAKFEVSETLKLKGDLKDVAFSDDGKVAVAVSRGEVTILDAEHGKVAARVQDVKMPVRVLFGR